MSQQGLRQASVRAVSGTTLTYEGDWHDMWDGQSIATGTFNERMLRYINQKLGTSYVEINGAMQALALDQGATNFGSMGTFNAALTASTGASILLGSETDGLAFSASDDSMEIRDTVTPANNFVGSTITKFGAVRASAGTYYNSSQIIVSSASGLRRDYDPRLGGVPKYLCEPAATNLSLNSEVFSTAWNLNNIVVTNNSIAAPDGNITADLLTATATTSFIYATNSTVAAGTFTWSCFVKKGTALFVALGANDGAASNWSWFNLTTGLPATNSAGNTSTMIALPGGWYRCTVTRTIATTSAGVNIGLSMVDNLIIGGTPSSNETLYVWGGQLEAGPTATSYIPTTSATVTRATDGPPQWTTLNISQTAGTLYANYTWGNPSPPAYLGQMSVSSGPGDAESVYMRHVGLATIEMTVVDGGVSQATFNTAGPAAFTTIKASIAYALNDFAGCVNGGTVSTDTGGTLPTTTALNVFFYRASSVNYYFQGWMAEALQVNTRKSNAAIQALTT